MFSHLTKFYAQFLISKNSFQIRKHILVFFTFIAIVYYPIFVLLGIHGTNFIGDENQWIIDLRNSSLTNYLKIKDAGYFVYIPRLLLYILDKSVRLDGSALHIWAALIASVCSVSVIYLLNTSFSNLNNFLLSLVIGFYPTFGLLTWMNLSYYIFIPTLIILLKLDLFKKISFIKFVSVLFLVIWVAKPQLILSLAVLLLIKNFIYIKKYRKLNSSLIILAIAGLFVIISRSNSPLDVTNNVEIFGYLFLNMLYIPISIIVPLLSVALIGYIKMFSIPFIEIPLKAILAVFTITFVYKMRKIFGQMNSEFKINVLSILSVIATIYMSFFAQSGSIFSTSYFWNINCRSCVYDRHIFPFFIALVLLCLTFTKKRLTANLFLLGLLVQEVFITYFAYEYLFVPVLKV